MQARTAVGVILVTAGLALAALSAPVLVGQERAVSSYEELADETAHQPNGGIDEIDWNALLAANPSLTAWCRVEGTSIDLPVCQASDEDPDHWLAHDFWGGESTAGTPYVDHRATARSRHVLCYGHHLAGTGGMFSDVYRCHEQAEFERWLTGDLVWSTPDGTTMRLRPLCASSQDMGHALIQRFGFHDASGFRSWLREVLAQSSAVAPDAGLLADTATSAVTLVTCSSDLSGQRERTLVTFAS